MSEKRIRTLELQAIRAQLQESPPPPPAGTTVREWFAGLALMNPELMRGVPTEQRAQEAARLANELTAALAIPRVPAIDSLQPPSENELQHWEESIVDSKRLKESQARDTMPEGVKRKTTASYDVDCVRHATLPPPPPMTAAAHFKRASDHLARAIKSTTGFDPNAGRYSSIEPDVEDTDK